jgi:hypothetical protein
VPAVKTIIRPGSAAARALVTPGEVELELPLPEPFGLT